MLVRDDTHLVGEVHCLNCGRTLAEVVRNPMSGKLRLRSARYHHTVEAILIARRSLRCAHCHGTALVEPVLRPELQVEPAGRDSLRPISGAA